MQPYTLLLATQNDQLILYLFHEDQHSVYYKVVLHSNTNLDTFPHLFIQNHWSLRSDKIIKEITSTKGVFYEAKFETDHHWEKIIQLLNQYLSVEYILDYSNPSPLSKSKITFTV